MRTLNGINQGDPAWHDVRARYHTASEAPALMGASPKLSRNDLLRLKATGGEEEHSEWVKNVLFARGHAVEDAARPIAEEIIGEELYPAVATDDQDYLLASFDGVTLLEDVVWECKQWNKDKAREVEAGRVPAEDFWQVIHQFAVSGAARALYMVTDGTEDGTVSCWVTWDQEAQDQLVAAWRQFDADLANFTPQAEPEQPQGSAPDALPALRVEVSGEVTDSNLTEWRDQALAIIGSINTELESDEDFASAEKTTKWCKEAEQTLAAKKDEALSKMGSVNEVLEAVDEIKEEIRQKRLALDKQVKERKEAIRHEVIQERNHALTQHLQEHAQSLREAHGVTVTIPDPGMDVAAAIKGKKTIKSVRDAADQELVNAKLRADSAADNLDRGLTAYREAGGPDYPNLFRDLDQLLPHGAEYVDAVVRQRIADEERRLEAERERAREAERQAQQAASGSETETEKAAPSRDAETGAPAASPDRGTGQPAEYPQWPTASAQYAWATVSIGVRVTADDNDAMVADRIRRALASAGVSVGDIGNIQRGDQAA